MKEKERLLSLDEPLRFIFSHSALREGWDNPNVFQICTLNETRSAVKKRQEIGRGLRLPVDQNGFRVFDDSVNKLYVMANESYEEFARALQTEYEEDCGVTFGKVPLTVLAKLIRVVDDVEQPIGPEAAGQIRAALVAQGLWPKSLSTRAACRIGRPRMARHLGRYAQAQTFGHRPSVTSTRSAQPKWFAIACRARSGEQARIASKTAPCPC